MRKLKKSEIIVLGVLLVAILGLCIYNVGILKNDKFFEVSFSACISIIVVLLVSYWLTNNYQDERNQKEIYLHLLERVIDLVNDPYMYKIGVDSDIFIVLMKKRELNNTISLLKGYSKKFNVESELLFIDEKVQEYANLIGNHQEDLLHLSNSEKDLRRPLELIESKSYEVMMKIFE